MKDSLLMEDSLLKTIIFTWLTSMCVMDYIQYLLLLYVPVPTRLFMWGMNGLLIAAWFIGNIRQKRGFTPFRETGILVIVYLFLFWICVSIFFSQYPLAGIKQMFPFLVGLLDVYIFYDFFSRSKQNVYFFVKTVTFLVVFVSCWTVIESIQKISHGVPYYKNVFAGFCNPNFLGYFLFLFTPFMMSYYFIHSPFQEKHMIRRFLMIVVICWALFLSSSRSSWNGCAMAVVFLLSWKNKTLGVGILLLFIMVNSSIYILQGGQIYQTAWEGVYSDRAAAWDEYWKVAINNPLLGIGWGVIPPGLTHAHNVYLADVAQTGIFSLILIGAFYLLFFSSVSRTEKIVTDPYLRAILLGSAATYFGQIFYSLTDLSGILVAFSANSISFMPYILIALPLAIKNVCQKDEERTFYERDRIISTAAL